MRRDEWRDNDRNRLIFASPRRVHSRERYDRAEVRGWKARKRIVERLGACRRNGATGENARPAARDAINDEIISTNCVRPFQRFQGPYDSRSCFSSSSALLERISNEIAKKEASFLLLKEEENWMCTLKLILKGEGDLSWGFEEKYIYI